ncbi:site-specific integrase [Salinimicrobium catena]|uniref:site-specific integrase n=1 Tax=Salinimicrobium catena TaxID=390640 RepID=UPI002FE4F84E
MPDFTTFSVLFFVRNTKDDKSKLSVYARITVNGKRTELSLKRTVPVNYWDTSKGRGRGTSPIIKKLNQYLDQVNARFLDCHKELCAENKVITAKSIKARFLGTDARTKTLMELVDYHNKKMVSILKPGTLKNYHTTEKYLKEFLAIKFKSDDIFLSELNYKFITEFEIFIRTYSPFKDRKICSNNGTMKHLERLKKMVRLAVKLEWLPKNPFISYQLKFSKSDRQFLNEHELERLENTQFTRASLERTKDIFLFSCFSGLSYIDIKNLSPKQLLTGTDGKTWIYTKREKTSETVKIPLLYQAQEILSKYQKTATDEERLFPVVSNQQINSYLKEIASACGIRKKISFHSARHTFATTVTLSNGVPIETVSKLLGHSKLSTTQIYARVLEQKLSADMENLSQTFMRKREEKLKTRM